MSVSVVSSSSDEGQEEGREQAKSEKKRHGEDEGKDEAQERGHVESAGGEEEGRVGEDRGGWGKGHAHSRGVENKRKG